MQLKFLFTSNLGTSLYIDDFELCGTELGIEKQHTLSAINIFPNPIDNNSVISFHSDKNQKITVEICDLYGRNLKELWNGNLSAGKHDINLNTTDLPGAAGIYFVKFTTADGVIIEKIIKRN